MRVCVFNESFVTALTCSDERRWQASLMQMTSISLIRGLIVTETPVLQPDKQRLKTHMHQNAARLLLTSSSSAQASEGEVKV